MRALSKNLCIGKNTIENAYSQLCLEGYVINKPRSGFVVLDIQENTLPTLRDVVSAAPSSAKLAPFNKSPQKPMKAHYDFQYGNLDPSFFPSSLWRRLTSEVLGSYDTRSMSSYNDKQGELDLRIEVMNYLRDSRGVRCTPEQVVLCCGTQYALDLICKLFPEGKRKVAFEEPGYDGARIVFENNGFEIDTVSVGTEGLDLHALEQTQAKLTYITPSHQFPTGMVMPIQQRIQLLKWADQRGGYIIEDDYDSEFRYHSRPIPSLQSIDDYSRVIYLGTFSKSFSPGLRMSYVVFPQELLSKYHETFTEYESSLPWLEQKVMSLYMARGHWEQHLRKVCLANKKKHDALLQAVQKQMSAKVKIHGANAGLHILLEFLGGEKQEWLIDKAQRNMVQVYPTRQYWYQKEACTENFILMGFSKLTEDEIAKGVSILKETWFA
jgi:GntR family transcriptional regulator / MocR family aminotransferase